MNPRIVNLLKDGKPKIIHGNITNIEFSWIEWIKWLSYEPEFQKLRKQSLNSKMVKDLSIDELDEIRKYKKQEEMAKLFKMHYENKEISESQYIEIYNFMANESIENIMITKLSSEELSYVKNEINRFSQIPNNELKEIIKNMIKTENYEALSMPESYILHIISKIDFERSIGKLDREINSQIATNNVMKIKNQY